MTTTLPEVYEINPIPPPEYEVPPEKATFDLKFKFYLRNLKRAAIYYTINRVYQELCCCLRTITCQKEPFANMGMPHHIFCWDKHYTLKRRELSTVWFSLLLQKLSPQCLETRKFLIDVREVMNYLMIINKGYFQHVDGIDYMDAVDEAKEYLELENNIEVEQNMHKRHTSYDVVLSLYGFYVRRLTRELILNNKKLVNEEYMIKEPLANEYKRRTFENMVSQCYWKNNIKENRIYENTKTMAKKTYDEHFVTRIVINVYAAENEMLRQRIIDIKHANDVDSEYCENVRFNLMTKLEKLRASRKHLAETIEWYKLEIQEFQLKEKIRAEKQLRREEMERLQELRMINERAEQRRQRKKAKAAAKKKTKKLKNNKNSKTKIKNEDAK